MAAGPASARVRVGLRRRADGSHQQGRQNEPKASGREFEVILKIPWRQPEVMAIRL